MAPQVFSLRLPAAALAVLLTATVCAQDGVGVSLPKPSERKLTSGPHEGHTFREQTASFSTGVREYGISYKACVDPAHAPDVGLLEGYIGMPVPTSCNWYHSGFLFVEINGRDLGPTPLSTMLISEDGKRAMVDLVWHAQVADVRVRFLALPAHDNLLCEVALEPREEITSLTVKLRCYPSYFTSWNKRDGARRVRTPSALVEQGKAQTLSASENWYGVYYDEVFDVARGEGEGPCAMMLLPDEASWVSISPGGYSVETAIAYPPETRRLHLAFWDFKGVENAAALERITGRADADRDELKSTDFTPATVAEFDIVAVREQLQQALASAEVRKLLGEKLTAAKEWVDRHAGLAGQPQGQMGITAQEELLQSADQYRDLMWEVKLAELVSGL